MARSETGSVMNLRHHWKESSYSIMLLFFFHIVHQVYCYNKRHRFEVPVKDDAIQTFLVIRSALLLYNQTPWTVFQVVT